MYKIIFKTSFLDFFNTEHPLNLEHSECTVLIGQYNQPEIVFQ